MAPLRSPAGLWSSLGLATCLYLASGAAGAAPASEPLKPLPPDVLCLTGNGRGVPPERNRGPKGSYTYTEPMTTAPNFPIYWAGRQMQEPGLYAGWIPFDKGRLTDGNPATCVEWARFWTGVYGHDITFDLGRDFEIVRVVVHDPRNVSGLEALFLKSADEPRYVCVADKLDLVAFNRGNAELSGKTESVFDNIGQPARWVRVQCRFKSGTPSEIEIWGRPLPAGKKLARVPYLQDGGAAPVQNPQSRPVSYTVLPPVFPVPKEIALSGDDLPLKNGLTIAFEPAGSERARATAEVLRDELKECYGLTAQVAESAPGVKADILIGEAANSPATAKALGARGQTLSAQAPGPQGYVLVSGAQGVVIGGCDPAGAFYGVQTLLSLVRHADGGGWRAPGAVIHDRPDMPIRYIQGRPPPSKDLIRALARFRINYYMPNAGGLPEAVKFDAFAERYFITFVPSLDFNAIVLAKDPNLVERAPTETPEKLGVGRRNANPNNPKSWEIYEAECKTWLPKLHGDLVDINWDETYQSGRGARWNVSAESRALHLSAGPLLAHTFIRIDKLFKSYGKKIVMQDTAFLNHKLSYPGDPDPYWNKALDLMPKDITFLVWHPKETNALLQQKGFRQVRLILDEFDWRTLDLPGPYSGIGAYMAESAFTPAKLIELVGVTWNCAAPRPQDRAAVAAVSRSVQLWNAIYQHTVLPSQYACPADFTPIALSQQANRSRVDEKPNDGQGWVDLGPNCDLRALPPGRQEMGGIPFQIIDEAKNAGNGFIMLHNREYVDRALPQSVEIPTADLKAASLIFLHCLDNRPGQNYLRRKELAGFYFMVYEDGTYAKQEIKYAVNTANWDGRPTKSGYNPKGHSMTNGWLAWEGDTLSGMPGFLYATEWVNPKPQQKIAKILFRAAHMPGNMNPMLLAVTAVNPALAAPAGGSTWPVALIAPAQPVGKPLDLLGGKDESELRYVAPDGTVISAETIDNAGSDKGIDSGMLYRSYVGIVNVDGLQAARTDVITYTFPAPRPIAGALVTGAYRTEKKIENFGSSRYMLTLESSSDGKTWAQESVVRDNSPEEHGPAWMEVKTPQVRYLRVRGQPGGSAQGFANIRIFQR